MSNKKTKVPKIDQEKCIGCGLCVNLCPSVFKMGENGKAEVINLKNCSQCDCETVVQNCPVQAITLE